MDNNSCVCGARIGSNDQHKDSGIKLPDRLPVKHETPDLWLRQAVIEVAPIFELVGYHVPEVRVALGWTSGGMRGTSIGECWSTRSSNDGINAIYLSTQLKTSVDVLDVLMHELVHAVDDCQHKHGREFSKIGKRVGLEGPPWRSASAGKELLSHLRAIAIDLGDLPYANLTLPGRGSREMTSGRVSCPECGYSCRSLAAWQPKGMPLCPIHKVSLLGEWEQF